MGRPLKAPIVLLCAGGLFAGSLLCGCLSLSIGGKTTSNAVPLPHSDATTQKLEQIESRLQSLEQRCGNCPAEAESPSEGTAGPVLTSPILPTPVETP